MIPFRVVNCRAAPARGLGGFAALAEDRADAPIRAEIAACRTHVGRFGIDGSQRRPANDIRHKDGRGFSKERRILARPDNPDRAAWPATSGVDLSRNDHLCSDALLTRRREQVSGITALVFPVQKGI